MREDLEYGLSSREGGTKEAAKAGEKICAEFFVVDYFVSEAKP